MSVDRPDATGLREAVEALANCTHGPRHYYAVDATCQRCEMPSWVEAEIRAALAAHPEPCHRGYPYCDGKRPCACPCHDPETADLLAASHALTTADERAHLAEQTSREEP